MNKPMYRIRAAAAQAGVSTQLLRAWERRYGLVEPSRTDSGYRVYSEDDIWVLRGARRLTETGLSIAEVARLPRRRLREEGTEGPSSTAPPRSRRSALATAPGPAVSSGASPDDRSFLADVLVATRGFDADALERLLHGAAGRSALTPTEICETILLPVLVAIGGAWETGDLSVGAEHFGSRIVRARLTELVELESRRRDDGPIVVCACPSGESHEGALLAFAVDAASRGYQVVYLGADTPLAEIVAVADQRGAHLCALSLTRVLTTEEAADLLRVLGRWRRKQPARRLLIGGRGAGPHAARLRAAGLEVFERVSAPLVESSRA